MQRLLCSPICKFHIIKCLLFDDMMDTSQQIQQYSCLSFLLSCLHCALSTLCIHLASISIHPKSITVNHLLKLKCILISLPSPHSASLGMARVIEVVGNGGDAEGAGRGRRNEEDDVAGGDERGAEVVPPSACVSPWPLPVWIFGLELV